MARRPTYLSLNSEPVPSLEQILRNPARVSVVVRGVVSHGYPFMQTATVIKASRTSVELAEIDCLNGAADIVTLEYHRRRCRYRISWIGTIKDGRSGRAGLESLDPINFIFEKEVGTESKANPTPQAANPASMLPPTNKNSSAQSSERRLHPRYSWGANAQVRKKGIPANTPCRVTDISLGGCYVEMMMPFPEGTAVELDLFWQQKKFMLDARVATSHPSIGMGIAFFGFSAEQFHLLQQLIEEISCNKHPAASSISNSSLNPAILAQDILQWFEQHETLSRTQFESMLQKQKPKSVTSTPAAANTGTD